VLGNQGPFPGSEGACSGYLIEHAEARLLLDCGPGVLARLQRYAPLETLSLVVLSHLHADHMSDMLALRYAGSRLGKEGCDKALLPVYMPSEPVLERELIDCPLFGVRDIADSEIQAGEMRLSFYKTQHTYPCYAVCVECGGKKLVYSGDTLPGDPGLVDFARGADVFLCDAQVPHALKTPQMPHPTGFEAGQRAKAANVKLLLLTHILPSVSYDDLIADASAAFPYAMVAQPSCQYEI